MIIKLPMLSNELQKIINENTKGKESNINDFLKLDCIKKDSLPFIECEIKQIIAQIEKDIRKCDAQSLLERVSLSFLLITVDDITDVQDVEQFSLEYLYSFITSVGELNDLGCNDDIYENIISNIKKLEENIQLYIICSIPNKYKKNEIMILQILRNLFVRGDSFYQHKIDLCKELFSALDRDLKSKYNLTSLGIIDEFIRIIELSNKKLNVQQDIFQEMGSCYEKFLTQLPNISSSPDYDVLLEQYSQSEQVKNIQDNIFNMESEYGFLFSDSIFKVEDILLPKEIVDRLTIKIGENDYFSKDNIKNILKNHNSIHEKPFVLINDDYFCFNPYVISNNLHRLLENIILGVIKEHRYYKIKGEYLEKKSLELFEKLLPNCKSYQGLKYYIDNIDYEVDGLILYDNNLFIIEAKSCKFTDRAKQGDLKRIERNVKDIVETAYTQAMRTKKYILSNNRAEFKDCKGDVTLVINKEDINNIYLINTTLEPLNHISSKLSLLKEFDFIQGDDWIWSIYLNDLRVIADLIDSPSEFLLYVDRRIKFNDYPQIKMMEEMNIFGYFLKAGLYFEHLNIANNTQLLIDNSFSQCINEYYYIKDDESLNIHCKKPSFLDDFDNNIKALVQEIERIGKKGFSKLTMALLGLDIYMQGMINEQVSLIRAGKRIDFHFCLKEINTGILFIKKELIDRTQAYRRCELYSYANKINNWFVIFIDDLTLDFEYFYFNNDYNKQLESQCEQLRISRLEDAKRKKGKISRNETCPCGSGKKYKKCCLNR